MPAPTNDKHRPVPPVKFDDLAKPSGDVLNEDFRTSGYQLKAKQLTGWDGAVVSTAVDLVPESESVKTPAKLTWKLPNPMGIQGLAVDKLEVDKAGVFNLEVAADRRLHTVPDLKLEFKSDLTDQARAKAGFTYLGIPDTQVRFETTPLAWQNHLTMEVTRVVQNATLGAKWTGVPNLSNPDLGLRVDSGPVSVALVAKDRLRAFTAHGFFQARDDIKVAASYEQRGSKPGAMALGVACSVAPGTILKAKVQQTGAVSATIKHELSKGFTVLAGGRHETETGKQSFGFQVSIE